MVGSSIMEFAFFHIHDGGRARVDGEYCALAGMNQLVKDRYQNHQCEELLGRSEGLEDLLKPQGELSCNTVVKRQNEIKYFTSCNKFMQTNQTEITEVALPAFKLSKIGHQVLQTQSNK